MNRKRGQLTIFVIIAVVVFILIGLYLLSDGFSSTSEVRESYFLRASIEECLLDNFQLAINEVGLSGGYPLGEEGYYYERGEVLVPTVAEIERVLEDELVLIVVNCVAFYNDSYEAVNLDYGAFVSEVVIGSRYVEATVDLRVSMVSGDASSVVDFSESSLVVESDILKMHELSKVFVDGLSNDDEAIYLTELIDLAEANDLMFNYYEHPVSNALTVVFTSEKEGVVPSQFIIKNELNYDSSGDVGFLL